MNREKESIRSLESYVTNPTVCSVKLDANEGDKDLYRDLLKKLGESDITLNYYPDDSYSELKKEINNYVGSSPYTFTLSKSPCVSLTHFLSFISIAGKIIILQSTPYMLLIYLLLLGHFFLDGTEVHIRYLF